MTRKDVLEAKEDMEYNLKQMQITKIELTMLENNYDKAKIQYRICEVKYVIERILDRMTIEKIPYEDLDLYLTHCLNCLNGNIDGTVLDMDKE